MSILVYFLITPIIPYLFFLWILYLLRRTMYIESNNMNFWVKISPKKNINVIFIQNWCNWRWISLLPHTTYSIKIVLIWMSYSIIFASMGFHLMLLCLHLLACMGFHLKLLCLHAYYFGSLLCFLSVILEPKNTIYIFIRSLISAPLCFIFIILFAWYMSTIYIKP